MQPLQDIRQMCTKVKLNIANHICAYIDRIYYSFIMNLTSYIPDRNNKMKWGHMWLLQRNVVTCDQKMVKGTYTVDIVWLLLKYEIYEYNVGGWLHKHIHINIWDQKFKRI